MKKVLLMTVASFLLAGDVMALDITSETKKNPVVFSGQNKCILAKNAADLIKKGIAGESCGLRILTEFSRPNQTLSVGNERIITVANANGITTCPTDKGLVIIYTPKVLGKGNGIACVPVAQYKKSHPNSEGSSH